MSFTITVDATQAEALLSQMDETTSDLSEGLLAGVESALMPDLELLSSTLWNVETGQYMSSWEASAISTDMVEVVNTAEAMTDGFPYSLSLEYGWTGVHGDVHAGGYVAEQAADDSASAIGEALLDWVMSQLPQ